MNVTDIRTNFRRLGPKFRILSKNLRSMMMYLSVLIRLIATCTAATEPECQSIPDLVGMQLPQLLCSSLFVATLCQEVETGGQGKEGALVSTSLGLVRGTEGKTDLGTRYAKYTKVPYAEPPTGALRLREPVSKRAWSGELDASQVSPACLQFESLGGSNSGKGQEDCLYLNIFAPNPADPDLKPVLLWIHGGAFTEGDANALTDPQYLLDQDVVFVSIHYRLGLLGFLAVENSTDLTGNLGLKDQQEAMRWVQRNIAFFGGDPEKVTIFGESAGAVSVHDHILSPTGKGLFRAAILQSGTALLSYEKLVQRTIEKDGWRMLEKLGCAKAKDIRDCLLLLEAEAFVDPNLDAQVWPVQVQNHQQGRLGM